jgi:integrase
MGVICCAAREVGWIAQFVAACTRAVADATVFEQRARDTAGLRALRFHALRHAAGSLVAREAGAHFVQAFLGHSRMSTTERLSPSGCASWRSRSVNAVMISGAS